MAAVPKPRLNSDEDTSLATRLFFALKERIIRWEYLPGERLTEEELCHEFNVSRSPVREALRMLAENGLLDKLPRRGYQIKELDLPALDELYEVRIALEMYAVGRAAESMPPADWQRLYEFWSVPPRNIPPGGLDLTREDEEFHEILTAASGNSTLLQYLRVINERLRILRMTDFTAPERVLKTYEQHRNILQLIADHRVTEAQEAVRANIDMSRKHVETAATEALAKAYLRRSSCPGRRMKLVLKE